MQPRPNTINQSTENRLCCQMPIASLTAFQITKQFLTVKLQKIYNDYLQGLGNQWRSLGPCTALGQEPSALEQETFLHMPFILLVL